MLSLDRHTKLPKSMSDMYTLLYSCSNSSNVREPLESRSASWKVCWTRRCSSSILSLRLSIPIAWAKQRSGSANKTRSHFKQAVFTQKHVSYHKKLALLDCAVTTDIALSERILGLSSLHFDCISHSSWTQSIPAYQTEPSKISCNVAAS